MTQPAQTSEARLVGRYALHGALATGGMATVHIGRLVGEVGFARTVAIKRLHPQFASDPDFRAMLLDEARVASRVRHPNVVSVIDVVDSGTELLLVMEYVRGVSLAHLLRAASRNRERVPVSVAIAICTEFLEGLYAAHEARAEDGTTLGIVHRDVSPQNVVVGADGVSRVLDFGIAKAAGSVSVTQEGQIKGKLAYMAPEQLQGRSSPQSDIYSAGVVLWEMLTGRMLFRGANDGQTLNNILRGDVEPPSKFGTPPELDAVVARALSRDPGARFETARQMSSQLSALVRPAEVSMVGDWVLRLAGEALEEQRDLVSKVETIRSGSNSLRSAAPAPVGRSGRGFLPIAVVLFVAACAALGATAVALFSANTKKPPKEAVAAPQASPLLVASALSVPSFSAITSSSPAAPVAATAVITARVLAVAKPSSAPIQKPSPVTSNPPAQNPKRPEIIRE
jgi:eukaryotic-like serine/threonine-protein kinase